MNEINVENWYWCGREATHYQAFSRRCRTQCPAPPPLKGLRDLVRRPHLSCVTSRRIIAPIVAPLEIGLTDAQEIGDAPMSRSTVERKEIETATADLRWWEAIFKPLGCRVHGWSYRHTASVFLPSGALVEIDKNVLELIAAARAVGPQKD